MNDQAEMVLPPIRAKKPEIGERKQDHIQLAFESQTDRSTNDKRFRYEPMLNGHPSKALEPIPFLGKSMKAPIWISSMTGGTAMAYQINHDLAKVCKEYGLGMGLGSCRPLLESNDRFEDFNLRPVIGYDQPLYANLGIAQIEESFEKDELHLITEMVHRLEADGLIVHVNPLQEWLQPEGDRIVNPPVDTIKRLLDVVDFPIIVKEVGQGIGPDSLKALLQLPIAAVDFAAFGGTNFALLELLRSQPLQQDMFKEVADLGHTAEEMVLYTNNTLNELGDKALCKQVIISGGVRNFLDGYYLTQKLDMVSVYGQASAFLKQALKGEEQLREFVEAQIKGLQLAHALLKVN